MFFLKPVSTLSYKKQDSGAAAWTTMIFCTLFSQIISLNLMPSRLILHVALHIIFNFISFSIKDWKNVWKILHLTKFWKVRKICCSRFLTRNFLLCYNCRERIIIPGWFHTYKLEKVRSTICNAKYWLSWRVSIVINLHFTPKCSPDVSQVETIFDFKF